MQITNGVGSLSNGSGLFEIRSQICGASCQLQEQYEGQEHVRPTYGPAACRETLIEDRTMRSLPPLMTGDVAEQSENMALERAEPLGPST